MTDAGGWLVFGDVTINTDKLTQSHRFICSANSSEKRSVAIAAAHIIDTGSHGPASNLNPVCLSYATSDQSTAMTLTRLCDVLVGATYLQHVAIWWVEAWAGGGSGSL